MTFGKPHRHYRLCDSTNTCARELAAAGAPGGTVVTADEQGDGRGRQGRTWSAPPGRALLYSAILRGLDERHMLLPLAIPLAVCDAIEAISDHSPRVKWPNDVWIDERKVAGVLIEARPQDGWAVIGVGLNVAIGPEDFPPDLRETATSVGAGVTVPQALRSLNETLAVWTQADPRSTLTGFRARDALVGRDLEWADGSGTAAGVDDRGNLLVRRASGEEVSLGAGEVHLRMPNDSRPGSRPAI